jgi:glycine cleavage system transcriptional repressor
MNRQWFAIAAIGRDRPGIVADLSECVFECDCNLEDASMTMLGSEFATLMVVSGVGHTIRERISTAMKRLEWEKHLTIFLRPIENEPQPPAGHEAKQYTVTARGVDKAGIVAGVARCLADRAVWITDLRGRLEHSPDTGTPLYTLRIRANVPSQVSAQTLRQSLVAVAEQLGIEVSLEAAHVI